MYCLKGFVLCCAISCSVVSDSVWPRDYSPPGSCIHGDSLGKNTGVGCHSLLQGIVPTQGSNPGVLYRRWILYHLSHQKPHQPRIHRDNRLKGVLGIFWTTALKLFKEWMEKYKYIHIHVPRSLSVYLVSTP